MRPLIIALLLVCASVAAQEGPPVLDVTPAAVAVDGDAATKEKGTKLESAKLATAGGWQHLRNGDTAASIKLFNTAASLNPNDANAYWGLGVAMAQQRKFDISLQLFERACKLDPNNARLAVDTGLAYTRAAMDDATEPAERKQRLQKALSWFGKAEKLEPSYALTYANRAVTWTHLGDYFAASKDIARAEALDRSSIDPKLVAYLAEKSPRRDMAAAGDETKPASAATTKIADQGTVTSPESTQPTTPPVKEAEQGKSLRVIGEPSRYKGPDKRHCLDLPNNEEIIRCVYPRR